jgi:hypothetical protein
MPIELVGIYVEAYIENSATVAGCLSSKIGDKLDNTAEL